MNLIPEKITNSTKVTLLLLILLGLDLFAGIWFFRAQQQQQERLIENQLTAIGNLKIKEIEDWRQRMVDEATLLTESPFFAKGVELYMQAPQVENAQALLNRIRSITTHYHPQQKRQPCRPGKACRAREAGGIKRSLPG
jgi:hypothetical protein